MKNANEMANSASEQKKLQEALKAEKKADAKVLKVKALEANLDDNNLINELKKVTVKKPTKASIIEAKGPREMKYRYATLIPGHSDMDEKGKAKAEKVLRKKIRKNRNNFLDSIISLHQAKNIKALNEEVTKFKAFYMETYSLNDYSLNSLADTRSDEDILIKVRLVLDIVSKSK